LLLNKDQTTSKDQELEDTDSRPCDQGELLPQTSNELHNKEKSPPTDERVEQGTQGKSEKAKIEFEPKDTSGLIEHLQQKWVSKQC